MTMQNTTTTNLQNSEQHGAAQSGGLVRSLPPDAVKNGAGTGHSHSSAGAEITGSSTPFQDGSGDFSPDQIKTMATWVVESGQLSEAEVNEALKSDGIDPLPAPVDPDSPAAEFNRWNPVAKPEDYQLPPMPLGPDGKLTAEALQLNQFARSALSEGKFSREVGSFLASEVDKTAQRYSKMNDSEKEIYTRENTAVLQRLWGDDYQKNIQLAETMVMAIEHKVPGFGEFLEETGAASNPIVISQLLTQASALLARQGKKSL